MTLKTLLKNIGEMAVKQKLVKYSAAGASLAEINPMEVAWYPLFYAIPAGTHTISENIITFSLTLYYIDRLLEDNSNEVDIFSSSIENLRNIIIGISNLPGVYDVENNYTMNNFMPEKLNDRLCGSYATVRISVVADSVCYVEEGEEPEPIDYSKMYLTIEALEDGTFYVRKADIGYSVNGGEWETTTGATSLSLNQGDAVRFKGTAGGNGLFSGNTLAFDAYGNIESLEYGDDYIGQTTIKNSPSLGAFGFIFSGCTGTRNAENLILPATTLKSWCYRSMFASCTSLTTAPKLPATTLAGYCYYCMFQGCTSLSTVHELPATELSNSCYYCMFRGCTSLTTAPELTATRLIYNCYYWMFRDCTSLTTAPELPATTLADTCYTGMFYGCTSLTTAPELPATTLAYACYSGMFSACRNMTTAPALPATTLANSCYESMFYYCTSLTTAPELPATTLASNCYNGMFRGCSNLNYIKCLATDISASNCTDTWVEGVPYSGTFVKSESMEGWTRGGSGIPSGWTIADA